MQKQAAIELHYKKLIQYDTEKSLYFQTTAKMKNAFRQLKGPADELLIGNTKY